MSCGPKVTLLFVSTIALIGVVGCGSATDSQDAIAFNSEATSTQDTGTKDAVADSSVGKIEPARLSTPASAVEPAVPTNTEPNAPSTTNGSPGPDALSCPSDKNTVFKDDVVSNVEPPTGLDGLVFIDTDNNRVRLNDYIGHKNVVLVFTEGFSGMLCPFCKTQTSRLVANYDKFKKLNTEVLVVYPGERDHVDEFITAAKTGVDKKQIERVPFPIVLDVKMAAVDHFDIRSELAHPSTYVIDKLGKIQLAYVGKDMSPDRPSIKALLETLQSAEDRS